MESSSKFLSDFSDKERESASKKYNIIKPYLEGEAQAKDVAIENNVPSRTFFRWVKNYRNNGLVGLIDKQRSGKGKSRSINKDVVLLIEGLALRKHKPSIKSVYRNVKNICTKNNWNIPTYATVYNIVTNINPALKTLAHEGEKAFSEKYDILVKRNTKYPNEVWQADHSLLPVWLIDGDDYKRPWLTIIMDDYSRCVAGYYLTFQSSCNTNTSLALRQAMWYKSNPKWHICGIPDKFYTDNGSDFTSKHMEQVGADLKMNLIFSIPGEPRGRGIVERYFETIEQLLLCDLPGYSPNGEKLINMPKLRIDDLDLMVLVQQIEQLENCQ